MSTFHKGGVPSRSGFLVGFLLPGAAARSARDLRHHLDGRPRRAAWMYGVDKDVKLGFLRLGFFWHFLDIVWIAIFSVVYLRRAGVSARANDRGARRSSHPWASGGSGLRFASLASRSVSTRFVEAPASRCTLSRNIQDREAEYRRELHSYIWGVSLALTLTFGAVRPSLLVADIAILAADRTSSVFAFSPDRRSFPVLSPHRSAKAESG